MGAGISVAQRQAVTPFISSQIKLATVELVTILQYDINITAISHYK